MGFEKLTAYLDGLKGFGIPGCDLVIMRDHEVIYRHFAGARDEKGTPMNGKETYRLFSATKVQVSTAANQLISAGKLSLDDPVSKYLPEYANLTVIENGTVRPAKTVMTVGHLLTMTGGLDYDMPEGFSWKTNHASTREVARLLAGKPLNFDPGTRYRYSYCLDVVGAVIEVVSGEKLGDYMKNHIWGPVGATNSSFHETKEQAAERISCYVYNDRDHTSRLIDDRDDRAGQENFESGGGGLVSTVDDYIRVMDALACGGVAKTGNRILDEAGIERMRKPMLGEAQKRDFDRLGKIGYSYGLAVRTLVDKEIRKTGAPIGEFGWDGAAGVFTVIDPEHRLSMFYAQMVHGCGYAFNVVHYDVRDLMYEGLGIQ